MIKSILKFLEEEKSDSHSWFVHYSRENNYQMAQRCIGEISAINATIKEINNMYQPKFITCNCADPDCIVNGCKAGRPKGEEFFKIPPAKITLPNDENMDKIKTRINELQSETYLTPGKEIELKMLLEKIW